MNTGAVATGYTIQLPPECELHTSSWFDANIRRALQGQYLFLQQNLTLITGLTGTGRAAQYVVALYLVSSIPLYITTALLTCFQFIVTQTAH